MTNDEKAVHLRCGGVRVRRPYSLSGHPAAAEGEKNWRNTQAARHTTVDAMLLARCDLFVGQFSSNVFRLAYEMKTSSCDCVAPYASLDSKWCFDWALRSATNPAVADTPIIC